jgi:sec-independent protein translocase protein TatC
MTFFEHLEELRGVILRSLSALLLGCVLVGCFFPFFADLLNYPLRVALGEDSSMIQGLVTTSPMGIFSVLMQVCFLGGLAISLPVILFFIAKFISPALSEKEMKILFPGCIAILLLFIIGASFSYFYIIPSTLSVSIALNKVFGFQLIWSAPMYYGLVVWMTLGIGLCFEFPLALLVLIYLRIVSSTGLKKIRKHMVVAVLIAAGLITPTSDPLSLFALAIPLYALYELAILVGSRYERKREKERINDCEDLPWPVVKED